MYNVILRRVRGKISITHSECMCVALITQHAMRMRRIVLSYVACPALHFPTLFHKRHDFRKKLLKIKCAFSFSLNRLSEKFSFHEYMGEILKLTYIRLQLKYTIFLLHFSDTWNFPDRFSKNTQISKFIKNRPVGADKADSNFRQFCEHY
jgi:hypothetical protein